MEAAADIISLVRVDSRIDNDRPPDGGGRLDCDAAALNKQARESRWIDLPESSRRVRGTLGARFEWMSQFSKRAEAP